MRDHTISCVNAHHALPVAGISSSNSSQQKHFLIHARCIFLTALRSGLAQAKILLGICMGLEVTIPRTFFHFSTDSKKENDILFCWRVNKTVYTGFYCTLSQPSQRIPLQSQELANCQPVAAITIQIHSVISSLFPSLLHVMSCASVLSNVPMTLMYLRPRSARQRGPIWLLADAC